MTTVAATWFLKSEAGQPLGQVYRADGEAAPEAGSRVEDLGQVASFKELGPTCGMRRFEVIIKTTA